MDHKMENMAVMIATKLCRIHSQKLLVVRQKVTAQAKKNRKAANQRKCNPSQQ